MGEHVGCFLQCKNKNLIPTPPYLFQSVAENMNLFLGLGISEQLKANILEYGVLELKL